MIRYRDRAEKSKLRLPWITHNEEKLKKGFEQMFQTTPFQYLRDRRLEQAQQLLMDTEQSIEEVARIIGYANRSKFAAAFRKKFGVNPKSFQLHSRHKKP